eukprot:403367619
MQKNNQLKKPSNQELQQLRQNILFQYGKNHEKLVSTVILTFMNVGSAFTIEDVQRKIVQKIKNKSQSQASSDKLPSFSNQNSVVKNKKDLQKVEDKRLSMTIQQTNDKLIQKATTPKRGSGYFKQNSSTLQNKQSNQQQQDQASKSTASGSQYLKNKRYTVQLSPLQDFEKSRAVQQAIHQTEMKKTIQSEDYPTPITQSPPVNLDKATRILVKSLNRDQINLAKHTGGQGNHNFRQMLSSTVNSSMLGLKNGLQSGLENNNSFNYGISKYQKQEADKSPVSSPFRQNSYNTRIAVSGQKDLLQSIDQKPQMLKTQISNFQKSFANQSFNNQAQTRLDISQDMTPPTANNRSENAYQESFSSSMGGGANQSKRKKNYTMWDIVALQDSYQAKIDDSYNKQAKRQRNEQLAQFLQTQHDQKQTTIQSQQQLEKDFDRQNLQKSLETSMAIEDLFRKQKLARLQRIATDNIKKHQIVQKSQQVESLKSNIQEIQTIDIAQQIYQENILREQQKIQDQKLKYREEQIREIKDKQRSQTMLQSLEKYQEVETVNAQKQQVEVRDKQLIDHLNKIQQRDTKLQSLYNKPDIKTHAQFDDEKTKQISDIIKKQEQEVKQRELEKERIKQQRRRQMIIDMVTTNKQAENMKLNQTQNFMNRSFMGSNSSSVQLSQSPNKKMGQDYSESQGQSTVSMLNDYMIAMRNKQNNEIRKSNLREELQKQMQEKERQKVLERLQIDEKEFATSKKMLMRSLSPDLVKNQSQSKGFMKAGMVSNYGNNFNYGHIEEDDYNLGEEVQRLNRLLQ